jgi:hypothetical protein
MYLHDGRTLYQLAHQFLQDFCYNNPRNQEVLHKDMDLLMVRWFV